MASSRAWEQGHGHEKDFAARVDSKFDGSVGGRGVRRAGRRGDAGAGTASIDRRARTVVAAADDGAGWAAALSRHAAGGLDAESPLRLGRDDALPWPIGNHRSTSST